RRRQRPGRVGHSPDTEPAATDDRGAHRADARRGRPARYRQAHADARAARSPAQPATDAAAALGPSDESSMSVTETIMELAALERLQPEWDALAVTAALPMAAPAWMLAWWRHLAPEQGELRTLVVRDRGELIGIAPFFLTARRRGEPCAYRLLGADISTRVGPLAKPGREWEVSAALAALSERGRGVRHAETPPAPVTARDVGLAMRAFEPMPLASPWLVAL